MPLLLHAIFPFFPNSNPNPNPTPNSTPNPNLNPLTAFNLPSFIDRDLTRADDGLFRALFIAMC
jgi:hypothetical protein